MFLSDLPQGKSGIVDKIYTKGAMRRRLQDIGIVNGTYITCIMASPFKDPIAFYICGAVMALRREDAEKITVTLASISEVD